MPGKPFQSKLRPYETEIERLLKQNVSYRRIAAHLNKAYGLGITHNAVYSYVNAAFRQAKQRRRFFDGLDPDIRESLLKQLVVTWTYDSNAIEGNTLTLGETHQVLELGLTISGKTLKDHQEAYGHARAVDLVRDMADGGPLTADHIFDLHRTVMPESPIDALTPIGDWKRDYNGTTGTVDGRVEYLEYAAPEDVPLLMKRWISMFNKLQNSCGTWAKAADAYCRLHMSFVRIHPFCDGNGRMARLLANVPVLRGGFPPILISPKRRAGYINLLWEYQFSAGRMKKGAPLLPDHPAREKFAALVTEEWETVKDLVKKARERQARRNR